MSKVEDSDRPVVEEVAAEATPAPEVPEHDAAPSPVEIEAAEAQPELMASLPDDTVDFEDPELSCDLSVDETVSLVGQIEWTDDDDYTPRIIAFAGGKGGAGRSLLAANVAQFLARQGRDVVLADLDPAGSNLHSYLGLEPLLPNPGALLRGPGTPVVERLSHADLRLVRMPQATCNGPDDPLRLRVLKTAQTLGANVLVLDLGLQADPLTLDTFLSADASVVVVVPEPVAIERAYAFMRAALYRRILHAEDEPAVVARALLSADHVGQLDTPSDLVSALSGVHPNAAEAIRARVLAFSPKVLFNKCRSRADRELEAGMVSALRRRLGVTAEGLGGVEMDEAAWESTRRRRPLMLEYPGCNMGRDIERIARRLVSGAREVRT